MLGVNYQYIYCDVTDCKWNEKHELLSGKTGKVVETYYTCEKEMIHINSNGNCKDRFYGSKSRVGRSTKKKRKKR